MSELNRCNRCRSCKYCRQLANIPAWLWNIKLELSANMSPKESRAWCRDFAMVAPKDKNFDEARAPMLYNILDLLFRVIDHDQDNCFNKEYYIERLIMLMKCLQKRKPTRKNVQLTMFALEAMDKAKKGWVMRDAYAVAHAFCAIDSGMRESQSEIISDLFIAACTIISESHHLSFDLVSVLAYQYPKIFVLGALRDRSFI